MIVGITGLHRDVDGVAQTIGAGKDAAAEVLIAKHGFVRIGVADHIKRICRAVFGWSEQQLWGPSDERNKPDMSKPRGGKNGLQARESYAKACSAILALEQGEGTPDKLKELRRERDMWQSMGWLTPRYALQQLGTQWGRDCYDSVWIEDAVVTAKHLLEDEYMAYTATDGLIPRIEQCPQGEFEAVENWPKPLKGVVFSDVRFFNEYNAIKNAGGKIVRVKRFSWKPFPGQMGAAHESETQLTGYADDKFDYIIENGGDLAHLGLLVDRMVSVLSGRIIPYDESQQDVPPGLRQAST